MLNTLSKVELDSLPLNLLVQRMDEFLIQADFERYGYSRTISLPSEIFNSLTVQRHSAPEIRLIIDLTFSYLVQLELCSMLLGIENSIIYTPTYTASSWFQPLFRLREGVLNQYQIVSSRIVFEIFMELLHAIDAGKRIHAPKSKLKAFRKWLCDKDNRFHYFAHILLEAYKFDREFRTPEIHGSSIYPRKMLTLQEPSSSDHDIRVKLLGVLMSTWRPLIEILNDKRPRSMLISPHAEGWFEVFMSGSSQDIESKLKEMFGHL